MYSHQNMNIYMTEMYLCTLAHMGYQEASNHWNLNRKPDKYKPGGGVVKEGLCKYFAKLTGKPLCLRHFFNKVAGLRPEFLSHFFSKAWHCEFWEIFKNPFFTEHFQAIASDKPLNVWCSLKDHTYIKRLKTRYCFKR